MKFLNLNRLLILLSIVLVYSCQSEYTRLVKNELSTGKRNDTIFFNLRFGNTRGEFFEICRDLNRRRVARQGPTNKNVQVMLNPKDTTETQKKIRMLFYGRFNSDNIMTGMDVTFSYDSWVPLNTDLNSDKLLPVVQDTLLKWYPGNPFMKVKNVWVKVDGNRQIQLKKESDQNVAVLIEDLDYKYKTLTK